MVLALTLRAQPEPAASGTYVVSAYFCPGYATTGFFQVSSDLTNWTVIDSFPYPIQGATVSFTNQAGSAPMFFRAGYEL